MKKFFTLMFMCVLAMAAQAKITIYVQCDEAPFIWCWGAANGQELNVGDWPGTNQLTNTWEDPDTGDKFWTWTFEDEVLPINFLFNNGEASGTKQTGDVNGVTTDRYFILSWDDGEGNVSFVDVSEDYGVEIPDAVITKVTLAGNHNGWDGSNQEFTVVEEGKTYKLSVDMTDVSVDEDLWKFKFRPNGQDWVGYWDIYYDDEPVEGKIPATSAPEWLGVSDDGNFQIDFEATTERQFIFIVTWGGGKSASKNWQFKATTPTGINAVKAENGKNAAIYNLAGQRVNKNFRGIAIENSKKIVVK